jgi:ABC-type dipeptide/oligopeptide/nickel transport system permease subunit
MRYHPNLKLWYNGQNPSAPPDLSGNGLNGTQAGTIGNRAGIMGSALVTSASNYPYNTSASSLFVNSYTLCAWVYMDSGAATENCIMSVGGDTGDQIIAITTAMKINISSYGTVAKVATGTATLATGTWYFVVGTRDYTNQLLSVHVYGTNMQLVDTASIALGAANTANYTGAGLGVYIGSRTGGAGRAIIGAIDNPMIYNCALPTIEHRRLMLCKAPLRRY